MRANFIALPDHDANHLANLEFYIVPNHNRIEFTNEFCDFLSIHLRHIYLNVNQNEHRYYVSYIDTYDYDLLPKVQMYHVRQF